MKKQNNTIKKLTDKAFSRLIITSFLGIFVCVICLCSTTFAWFSETTPSAGNKIKTSDSCDLSIVVEKDGVPLNDIESGVELLVGEHYTVTLALPAGNASGYCIITAGENTYYSDYILRHNESESQTFVFDLVVKSTQTVTFESRWGIYTQPSDVVAGMLIIP